MCMWPLDVGVRACERARVCMVSGFEELASRYVSFRGRNG